jgi:hypothetical protein
VSHCYIGESPDDRSNNSLAMSPHIISSRVSSRAIRACSSTLAVYAELFPAAVPFRDLFEHITDEVLGGTETSSTSTMDVTEQILIGNYDHLAP